MEGNGLINPLACGVAPGAFFMGSYMGSHCAAVSPGISAIFSARRACLLSMALTILPWKVPSRYSMALFLKGGHCSVKERAPVRFCQSLVPFS